MTQIIKDFGKGRVVSFLFERGSAPLLQHEIIEKFSAQHRVLFIETDTLTHGNWLEESNKVQQLLESLEIRQSSFVGIKDASSIALFLALEEQKFVRTLTLIEPTCAPHPTLISKCIHWIEEKLPLGLPLRPFQSGFDASAFLHRVRCPVVCVTYRSTSAFVREQVQMMTERLPTAWSVELSEDGSDQLYSLIIDMQTVPVKCPQKKRLIKMGASIQDQSATMPQV